MTRGIQVKILYHNFDHMPIFLARLTQRGAEINTMDDLMRIYNDTVGKVPSIDLMNLPHTTLRRMCYMTIAIVGLSTKAVSQLRTHAKHLTFLSTSTQYSQYDGKENNYVMPEYNVNMKAFFEQAQKNYETLLNIGIDKDVASYILPQGLKKALIVSGTLADWEYVLSTRLCNRNTREVQYICELIVNEIIDKCGPAYVANMMPPCVYDKCREGKFSCGHQYHHVWSFKGNPNIAYYEV